MLTWAHLIVAKERRLQAAAGCERTLLPPEGGVPSFILIVPVLSLNAI
jgi:hypothetical protein